MSSVLEKTLRASFALARVGRRAATMCVCGASLLTKLIKMRKLQSLVMRTMKWRAAMLPRRRSATRSCRACSVIVMAFIESATHSRSQSSCRRILITLSCLASHWKSCMRLQCSILFYQIPDGFCILAASSARSANARLMIHGRPALELATIRLSQGYASRVEILCAREHRRCLHCLWSLIIHCNHHLQTPS